MNADTLNITKKKSQLFGLKDILTVPLSQIILTFIKQTGSRNRIKFYLNGIEIISIAK